MHRRYYARSQIDNFEKEVAEKAKPLFEKLVYE